MNAHGVLLQVRQNWKAGLTVALVSLPLSISLAIAANATPVMGLVTAIWAGLFAAIFGGSNFNVVGPTGALSGILAAFAIQNGVEMLPILAIASGCVVLVAYTLRWDRYIVFIPSCVMHGFTLGVACIIGLNQLNFAFGLTGLTVHEKFIFNIFESFRHIPEAHAPTIVIFAVALALLFIIPKISKALPGPIIVAVIGIFLGSLTEHSVLPFSLQTLLSKYGALRASIVLLPDFHVPSLDLVFFRGVFAISLVAILETLLSAKIADGMTKTKFNQGREVFGLAIANIASGLAGGIPATAALARTALNVKSGATSRASSILNALFILLIALVFFQWFSYLPLAIVASILVYVAIRMVEGEHFAHLYSFDRTMFWLSLIVAAVTIIEDPIIGILLGATVSLLIFVRELSKGQSEVTIHKGGELVARVQGTKIGDCAHEGDVTVYRITGELAYFNGAAHMERVKKINSCHTIIFNLRSLFSIDIDGAAALKEMIEERELSGRAVLLSGASELLEPILLRLAWYQAMQKEGRVFQSTTEALNSLGFENREKRIS
ncbi:MAG TPA: SulP family inorganic anion transporter [Candidatus Peribacterales bacterium]|nr:SulP family inorganic anion transporter [Candidatus Peribacterales bacterium]